MSTTMEQVEVTDPIGEAVENVEGWLEGLGDVLSSTLSGRLKELNEPLEKEEQEAQEKAQALRESAALLKPRVEAQRRILERDADEALASGDDAIAQAKRAEAAELDASLAKILRDAEDCERRAQALAAEQGANARLVFQQGFPEICAGCIAAEVALIEMLDRVWQAAQVYGAQVGIRVDLREWSQLTPDEHGPDWPKLRRWFGGRR